MLRQFLDHQLSLTEKGKPLHLFRPLVSALDTFLYEPPNITKQSPHIRDSIDLKRWMMVVVISLLPAVFMAIWNTGLQALVYSSADHQLMDKYLAASQSWEAYWNFVGEDMRWASILKWGLSAFLPVLFISYAVGGLWEALFAIVRKHEIAEGFLVTGLLYPLILPPTIPYWMVAVGVSVGVIFGKELFGGTGMNIMNPALVCRAFLFFGFPGRMSGYVWAGTDAKVVRDSLAKMNADAHLSSVDAYTQATSLALYNVGPEIKRIHVDGIATNTLGNQVGTFDIIEKQFHQWPGAHEATLGSLSAEQLRDFVTSPITGGGLGLPPGAYEDAYHFAALQYGVGQYNDGTFFFGNMIGSMGETSVLACLLGALFLIYTGVGSWRTMVAVGLGAFLTASFLQLLGHILGPDGGAWNAATLGFPAYKHLLLGSMAFGLVFMATDPVSSPATNLGKWIYGGLIGLVAITIRGINPAFPEGVMLAILMGNVFAPLIDHYSVRFFRRSRRAVL